jgi:hypothetical protein
MDLMLDANPRTTTSRASTPASSSSCPTAGADRAGEPAAVEGAVSPAMDVSIRTPRARPIRTPTRCSTRTTKTGRRTKLAVSWESKAIARDLAPHLRSLTYATTSRARPTTCRSSSRTATPVVRRLAADVRRQGRRAPRGRGLVRRSADAVNSCASARSRTTRSVSLGAAAHRELQCVSAPLATGLRRRKRTHAWRGVTLKQIAQDIAEPRAAALDFQGDAGPAKYKHALQNDKSDLEFLQELQGSRAHAEGDRVDDRHLRRAHARRRRRRRRHRPHRRQGARLETSTRRQRPLRLVPRQRASTRARARRRRAVPARRRDDPRARPERADARAGDPGQRRSPRRRRAPRRSCATPTASPPAASSRRSATPASSPASSSTSPTPAASTASSSSPRPSTTRRRLHLQRSTCAAAGGLLDARRRAPEEPVRRAFRVGRVSSVDASKAALGAGQFFEGDGFVSWDMQVLVNRGGDYRLPTKDTPVLCVLVDGRLGVGFVLGAIYTESDARRSTTLASAFRRERRPAPRRRPTRPTRCCARAEVQRRRARQDPRRCQQDAATLGDPIHGSGDGNISSICATGAPLTLFAEADRASAEKVSAK